MDELKYARLAVVWGRWKAEIIESLLEAHGIDVELVQDSLSHSSVVISFGRVELYVPRGRIEEARQHLESLNLAGEDRGSEQGQAGTPK